MQNNYYCIGVGVQQQCVDCTLINGVLRYKNGYILPNCNETQWVQTKSWPGTNNTPVYQVVPMPIDNYLFLFIPILFIIALKYINKINFQF